MNAYLASVIENVKKKHGDEPEFVQTVEEVLSFSAPTRPAPERARIFGNVTCAQCGETVSEHKARLHQGELLCLDCFQPYDRGW